MSRKLHIRKGDTVIVLSGEYKGYKGRVLEVFPDKERAIVEGVNMMHKHTKPNAAYPNGGVIEKEGSIHISKLMLVEPSTGEPTRTGRRKNDEGKLIRYSKKTNEDIK
jgi:large subunit ribosomal protein L24